MRKTIVSVLVTVAAISVFAEEPQLPHITVFGTATTEVVPDQMVWMVNVLYKGGSLEAVAAEHAGIVKDVLKLLKDAKVDEKTIQTSRMEFGENWEYMASSRVKQGYFASTDISFKITDFGLYSRLWFELAKISSVSVLDVSYDHTKKIELRADTREKALRAAKEKAEAMARVLGAAMGEPLSVEEDLDVSEGWHRNRANQNFNYMSNSRTEVGGGSGNQDGMSLGTIPIQARVKVVFRLMTIEK